MAVRNFAFVIPSLRIGGAELQTINQLNFLWEKGIRNCYCIVLTNDASDLSRLTIDKSNIKVFPFNGPSTITASTLKGSLGLSIELAKYLREKRIRNIIAVLPFSHFCCRLARLLLFYKKIELSSYYRGDYFSTSPLNTFSKKFFNKVNSILAFFFDSNTLFISKVVLEDISRNFFVRKSIVLPNSLPINLVGPELALEFIQERGIQIQNKFLILFPGRFHKQKGHFFFIECIADFVRKYEKNEKKMVVLLAGEGPERSAIISLIEQLGLGDRFSLIGVVDNNILLSLHHLSNVVVVPSINEGFGNVCIEGLMQKSTMLVSDVGGLSEIITDGVNGFKFQPLDKEEFIAKLKLIYCSEKNILDPEIIFKSFLNDYTIEKQVATILRHCNIKTDKQIES